ncbi:COG4223 family protein [Planktotalea arctica]|uniref:COG4223 family protein n=1 Tax=Planktotalea arctica TaxID=1481893 RepID=UPI00321A0324
MAKPTKGNGAKSQKPDIVEEIVEDTVDAAASSDASDPAEPIEVVERSDAPLDDAPDEKPGEASGEPEHQEIDAPQEPVVSTEVVRETVIERKGGFIPIVLGGVVAAGIGVASAGYIFPNGLPFGAGATQSVDLASEVKLQAGRIDDLTQMLENQPSLDTGPLDAAVAAVGDLQAQIEAITDSLAVLETRISSLEARRSADGSSVSSAIENELATLRNALDTQKGEIAQMIEQAKDTKQSAEDVARQTLARAAVTRILVALDSGASFEDALADVQANSRIEVPEALAQSAASGVPTLSFLSESYPPAARAALAAVRSEQTGGGVGNFLAKQFGVRSVAPREGGDPDAVLSRVEAAVSEGRIADALAQADVLPDTAKAPLAEWMAQANLRLSAAREAEALANSLNSQ